MEVQKYQLIPDETGYTLVLFLREEQTEFASGLGSVVKAKPSFQGEIIQFIRNHFQNIKINTVKIAVGTMLISSFQLPAITAEAKTKEAKTSQTVAQSIPYISHLVKKGDTLYKIAKLYHTNIDDIKRLNNLDGNTLFAGQRLQIPVASHTVAPGDTLYAIAKKYHSTTDKIAAANKLTNHIILPGQQLLVPVVAVPPLTTGTNTPVNGQSEQPATPGEENPAVPSEEEKAGDGQQEDGAATTSYTVVKGDTLFLIATRFNTTATTIKAMNNLADDTIFPGQKLFVPIVAPGTNIEHPQVNEPVEPDPAPPVQDTITYSVETGDTLYNIAKRFGTSIPAIKAANQLTNDIIYPGQKLVIPGPARETAPTAPVLSTGEIINQKNRSSYIFIGTAEMNTTVRVRFADEAGRTIVKETKADAHGYFSVKADLTSLSDGAITISAISLRNTGMKSKISTKTLTKKTAAPAAPEYTGDTIINIDNLHAFIISGKGNAGAKIYFTISDGAAAFLQGETEADENGYFISLVNLDDINDGPLTLEIKQTDHYGNESPATTVSLLKDTAPASAPGLKPLFSLTPDNQQEYLIEGFGEADGIIHLLVRDENGQERAFEEKIGDDGSFSFTVDLGGMEGTELAVEAYQKDRAGNLSLKTTGAIPVALSLPDIEEIDDLPVITQENTSQYSVSGTTGKNVQVELIFTDGTATVVDRIFSNEEGRFAATLDISTLKDGPITVRAASLDRYGNKGELFESSVEKKTTVLPVSQIILENDGKAGVSNAAKYRISGASAEEGGLVHIFLSDGEKKNRENSISCRRPV